MGCFSACFGKKQKNGNRDFQSLDKGSGFLNPLQADEKNRVPETKVDLEKELRISAEKRLALDAIVGTHEPISIENSINSLTANVEEAKDGSSLSSNRSHFPNNRYLNCRYSSSDEETESNVDNMENDGGGDDGDDDGDSIIEKVWTEAIPPPDEFNNGCSPIQKTRDKTGNSKAYHVLNPVENISQWKVAKIQGATLSQLNLEKENHDLIQGKEEPMLNEEISVDASLSNWLDTPGTKTPPQKNIETPPSSDKTLSKGSNPMWSIEDRPILGALTVEEIKQFSSSSTPKRSPTRSPEDRPIIGTVGTYWSNETCYERSGSSVSSSYKSVPKAARKYREDKKMNGHSTPFKAKLDRASRTNSPQI